MGKPLRSDRGCRTGVSLNPILDSLFQVFERYNCIGIFWCGWFLNWSNNILCRWGRIFLDAIWVAYRKLYVDMSMHPRASLCRHIWLWLMDNKIEADLEPFSGGTRGYGPIGVKKDQLLPCSRLHWKEKALILPNRRIVSKANNHNTISLRLIISSKTRIIVQVLQTCRIHIFVQELLTGESATYRTILKRCSWSASHPADCVCCL